MVRLALDAKGRLIALEARPKAVGASGRGTEAGGAFDWGALFAGAGLDPARFRPAPPERTPPMAFDARAAWTGTYAEDRPEQVRIEAAAWQGSLPPNLSPVLGPDYSPVGQLYFYTLTSTNPLYDAMELKSLEDWFVVKQLKSVPNGAHKHMRRLRWPPVLLMAAGCHLYP